jgi:PAS domain S-box-containing protein
LARRDKDLAGNHAEVIRQIPTANPRLPLPLIPERADRIIHLLAQSNTWITEADSKPQTIYASPSVEDAIGFTPEEVVKGECIHIHPSDETRLVEGATALAREGRPFREVIRMLDKQGGWRFVEITSQASYVSEDGRYQSTSLNRDITELVNAQRGLRDSEERYRVVSEMGRDLITEGLPDGRLVYISPAVEATFGYSFDEFLEMPGQTLLHPDDMPVLRAINDQEHALGEAIDYGRYRARTRDGRELWIESKGIRYETRDGDIHVITVSHNVTDEVAEELRGRELEEQLVAGQKLESLGVMAGGIAHDFNNLLTPILGEASLGLEDLPEDSPVRERLHKVRGAAQRAAALTEQMLSYAGKGPLQLESLDLSEQVNEMGRLFESAVSGKTVLAFDLARDLPRVEADAAQVSQVVINLISNASEALPDGAGTIHVRTGAIELDSVPSKALFAENLRAGRHVYLEVADTGCGMDAETQKRIFDPFYTTKFTGRGLGLAAVAGIVRGHRGAVEIESEPGHGTIFRVLFPAVETVGASLPRVGHSGTVWRASDTVLVIDDDASVRELAADILSRVGLQVVTAADGREGIEIYSQRASEIRIVLLDRTMPALSGMDVFRELRAIDPQACVILVSGFSEERAAAELRDAGLAGFLQKPFLPEALIDLVREQLEAPAS